MEIREVTYLSVAIRILLAVVIGGVLGLERGLKNRPAGLRTYMLVCTGACLIMLTNQYIFQVFGSGDPVRMGAQVVSGIGFLGGGTIIVTRHSRIKGLTTAAGLWAAAGVGLALGIGFYEAAVMGGFAIFTIMTLLQGMDNKMHSKTKRMDVYIELDGGAPLGDFLRDVRQKGLNVSNLQRETNPDRENSSRAYTLTLTAQRRCRHMELIECVGAITGVGFVEEL
ncbi:MAG: MgtC/SapB family protein [Oscillospiraceae bacterium]|nr:MgtC/SapB family protein [Oscillospiraceae bacterium]